MICCHFSIISTCDLLKINVITYSLTLWVGYLHIFEVEFVCGAFPSWGMGKKYYCAVGGSILSLPNVISTQCLWCAQQDKDKECRPNQRDEREREAFILAQVRQQLSSATSFVHPIHLIFASFVYILYIFVNCVWFVWLRKPTKNPAKENSQEDIWHWHR